MHEARGGSVWSDWRLAVLCSGRCDLERKKKNPLFSFIPRVLVLLFLYAYERPLILPNSRCVCDVATRAERPALLSALQSISHTHARIHHTPRWRSSSQCHFQFGWAHGLFRRYNGLDDGREMDDAAQVSRNKRSHFWSSHSPGAIFQILTPHCLSQLLCILNTPRCGKVPMSRCHTQKRCISVAEEGSRDLLNVSEEAAERNTFVSVPSQAQCGPEGH